MEVVSRDALEYWFISEKYVVLCPSCNNILRKILCKVVEELREDKDCLGSSSETLLRH